MSLASVVIANWNKKAYLKACLDSLLKQTHRPIEIIVVDNDSQDGSPEMVRQQFPQVKLLKNQSNQLYCRAQNQGIKAAAGEYIICLNNDAWLAEDCLEKMLAVAQADPSVGMVCAKVMDMGRVNLDSAGQILGRSRRPIERGYKNKDKGKHDQPEYIFSAGGVAPLYKRKMLEEIKIGDEYFDESYGMFYEDLDLAWRANQLAWRAVYYPYAKAYHLRGGSCKTVTPRLGWLKRYDFTHLAEELQLALVKNRYCTILKNDSLGSFLLNLPWIISYEIKIWTYFLFFRPWLIPRLIKNLSALKAAWHKRKKWRRRPRLPKKKLGGQANRSGRCLEFNRDSVYGKK